MFRRLDELESFKRVYALVRGVITRRNVDLGNLLNAGRRHRRKRCSCWPTTPTLSSVVCECAGGICPRAGYWTCRVPGAYDPSFPDKNFRQSGKNRGRIDFQSRTLNTELTCQ